MFVSCRDRYDTINGMIVSLSSCVYYQRDNRAEADQQDISENMRNIDCFQKALWNFLAKLDIYTYKKFPNMPSEMLIRDFDTPRWGVEDYQLMGNPRRK